MASIRCHFAPAPERINMRATSFHKIVASGSSGVSFPLTPALSPGEREHRRQSLGESEVLKIGEGRAPGLPLPEGEGRGEGERGVRSDTTPRGSKLNCRGT